MFHIHIVKQALPLFVVKNLTLVSFLVFFFNVLYMTPQIIWNLDIFPELVNNLREKKVQATDYSDSINGQIVESLKWRRRIIKIAQ